DELRDPSAHVRVAEAGHRTVLRARPARHGSHQPTGRPIGCSATVPNRPPAEGEVGHPDWGATATGLVLEPQLAQLVLRHGCGRDRFRFGATGAAVLVALRGGFAGPVPCRRRCCSSRAVRRRRQQQEEEENEKTGWRWNGWHGVGSSRAATSASRTNRMCFKRLMFQVRSAASAGCSSFGAWLWGCAAGFGAR